MKKHNLIEEIALDMASNEKYMPLKDYVVDDAHIFEKIKQVTDFEQTDRDGRTLLINAAFYGRESIINYLLSKPVNVNAKDNGGYTALHAAVQEGYIPIIELLLNNGADVNARDDYGNTPIMKTTLLTPHEVFKVLLQYGANPNEKNNYGMSVIDVYQAYPEIINILNTR